MVATLCFLLVAASGLLSPPKDAISQYEKKYESQYQDDLKKRLAKVDAEDDSQIRDAKDDGDLDTDGPTTSDGSTSDGSTSDAPTDPPVTEQAPEEETPVEEAPEEETPETESEPPTAGLEKAGDAAAAVDAQGEVTQKNSAIAANDQEVAAHHAQLDELLTESLDKLKASAKMMVVLHVLMQPVATKLRVSMENMPQAAKARSMEILHHMEALDALSKKSVAMLSDVSKVEQGSEEDRAAGVKHLMLAMKDIQNGVKMHLAAMKQHPQKSQEATDSATAEAEAPEVQEHHHKLRPMTSKLHALLAKMQLKVDRELSDPATKDEPKTAIDVEMLDTMRKSVKKSEALIVVASMLLKKASTPEDKQKVKDAVRSEMKKSMAELKEEMKHLKEKGVMMQALKAIKVMDALRAQRPPADEEEHSAPSDEHEMSTPHSEEHSAPSDDKEDKKEDREEEWTMPQDRASSAQSSEADVPEEKKSEEPVDSKDDAPEKTDDASTKKSEEPEDKTDTPDAKPDSEAGSESGSFMKKLEEDLKKFHDIHAGIGKDHKGDKADGMKDDSDTQIADNEHDSKPDQAKSDGDDSDAHSADTEPVPEPDLDTPDANQDRNSKAADRDSLADGDQEDATEPNDEETEHPPPHASKKHSDRKFKALLDELDNLKGSFKASPHDPNLRSDGGA